MLPTGNFVPNGSFETYSQCPATLNPPFTACFWDSPTVGTADYFNSCSTSPNVGVPYNFANCGSGYGTPALTNGTSPGHGYVGMICYSSSTANSREYLRAQLLSPIVSGRSYYAEFYARVSQSSHYSVAQLGMGTTSVTGATSGPLFSPAQLAVANPVRLPAPLGGNPDWALINGGFTATVTASHVVIGNFQSDAASSVAPGPGANSPSCLGVIISD